MIQANYYSPRSALGLAPCSAAPLGSARRRKQRRFAETPGGTTAGAAARPVEAAEENATTRCSRGAGLMRT